MKHLRAVVTLPYVTPKGRLVVKPGYDPETQLYLHLPPDYTANIPARPTPDQVCDALRVMVAPWALYRWAGADDAAAMVSAVIAAVVRPCLSLCPAYLFDASSPGSGKTLAACALGAVATSRRPSVHAMPSDGSSSEDELRKKLLASAMAGDAFICFDNVVGHLKSAVLAGYLTSGRLSDRVLGQSRVVDVAACALVTLTGNNASLWADLLRRTVRPRIDAGADPTKRRFAFSPMEAALQQRLAIAEAVCTVLLGYHEAGAPRIASDDAGGFTDWSALCRQPVLWAVHQGLTDGLGWGSLGDPAGSLLADSSSLDPEQEALADVLRYLYALTDGGRLAFKSRDVVTWQGLGATDEPSGPYRALGEALSELLGSRAKEPTARSLGRVLDNRRDRHCRGLVLRAWHDPIDNVKAFKVSTS
jgi:hypothetical protein